MSDVKGKTGAVLRETAVLTGAVAIIAAGVFFFLVPSHTSVSSISGLGIVLSNFVPLPLSVITMILNVVLLIIGFFTCGREFGVKTVYTSVLLQYYDWNGDSTDASGNNVAVSKLIANATSSKANNINILFHDTAAKSTTVQALPAIIENYKARGYRFEAITDSSFVPHQGINN